MHRHEAPVERNCSPCPALDVPMDNAIALPDETDELQ